MAYHKLYLRDEDLHDGYDDMLKKVERGQQQWDETLGEHLHEFLNFRGNILMRDKLQNDNNKNAFTKVEYKKAAERKQDGKEWVIYCQDYNNNRCPHGDHHEGKFTSNKITKWHICKRCNEHKETKSHQWTDDTCPHRNA